MSFDYSADLAVRNRAILVLDHAIYSVAVIVFVVQSNNFVIAPASALILIHLYPNFQTCRNINFHIAHEIYF